ncbi:MAG TPA: type II restriction endonuclease [Clostridiales bacterium]|nr:MjaI family restriction endonuclease [Eubacteriales bacterium]HBR30608.1 type II restriction endonuclease [Clostridiales bacterium]
MKFTIKNDELVILNGCLAPDFPKYTSQLINWANQNAQGTRPKVVGQLSVLFPEYEGEKTDISIDGWREWYLQHYPNAIEKATDKIYAQVENLKDAIQLIDKNMINKWVEDLVITKTYNGLYFQEAILSKIAEKLGKDYRLATPCEESQGIDGFVGDVPYSVKPDTYRTMRRLSESINVKIVYYAKKKTGLTIEVED